MLDEIAIQQTLNRYTEGASSADLPQVLSTFTPDAVFESSGMRLEGHAAMEAAMAGFVAEFAYFVQLNAPALITVNAHTATARSVIRECGKYADADELLETVGTHCDELVRTAEGWKITRRTFVSQGTHSLPLLSVIRMPGAGPRK
jgi:ketosteroid isomerase-like protein